MDPTVQDTSKSLRAVEPGEHPPSERMEHWPHPAMLFAWGFSWPAKLLLASSAISAVDVFKLEPTPHIDLWGWCVFISTTNNWNDLRNNQSVHGIFGNRSFASHKYMIIHVLCFFPNVFKWVSRYSNVHWFVCVVPIIQWFCTMEWVPCPPHPMQCLRVYSPLGTDLLGPLNSKISKEMPRKLFYRDIWWFYFTVNIY